MARILVVDDSRFQRRTMTRMLTDMGHEVTQAENGEMGLQMLDEVNPEVIITDLLMPVLDGIGLLKGLNERDCSTPVMVVTADIQETTREECLNLGAKAFLNKPYNNEQLQAALSRFLKPDSVEKA